MIATISALEKSSAIAAIIWKPLSSDRSDTIAEIDLSSISAIVAIVAIIWKPLFSDHSDPSDSKSTSMHCVRSRFSRWLPTQTLREQSTSPFLWRKYKRTTVFTTNIQRNTETSTGKSTAGKQSECNSIKVLNMSSLSFPSSSMLKNTHNYKKARLM